MNISGGGTVFEICKYRQCKVSRCSEIDPDRQSFNFSSRSHFRSIVVNHLLHRASPGLRVDGYRAFRASRDFMAFKIDCVLMNPAPCAIFSEEKLKHVVVGSCSHIRKCWADMGTVICHAGISHLTNTSHPQLWPRLGILPLSRVGELERELFCQPSSAEHR